MNGWLALSSPSFAMAPVSVDDAGTMDKAIGLRDEAVHGFKTSAAVGRGNGRNFGQVGIAWEF